MNEYLTIWSQWNSIILLVLLIIAMALAIFFEGKWLDERKKNKRIEGEEYAKNKGRTEAT